jgi:putative peptide zinc metalloprotease protein
VEIAERSERPSFIVGSASAGRYLLFGPAEREVLERLDGTRTPGEIRSDPRTLTRFLSKLEEVGILAGERVGQPGAPALPVDMAYLRWRLFNPDRLFARTVPLLSWVWTRGFFVASLVLMAVTALFALLNWPEMARYGALALRQHYLAILVVAWLVTITHEFAHGLTSKALGGRATEVGALLVYYCLPALYCNVSGLHLIRKRGQRLWVIAAGVYWQLLVGTAASLAWLLLNPDALPGRLAMVLALGSLLDLVFNANPLIKLDGYYFLSQWLAIPNLMDRSRACWRGVLWGSKTRRIAPREQRILLVFGLLSFACNLALPTAIAWYASQYLIGRFQLAGLLLSGLLAGVYVWRPLKMMLARKGGSMAETRSWRRRWLPAGVLFGVAVVLCLPWRASVGSYGTLVAIPGREAVIRAPENGSLLAAEVQPGQQVTRGAALGRMGNLDLEEQIAQAKTEIARVDSEEERIAGELGVERQAAESAEWEWAQRRREFRDLDAEQQQIGNRLGQAAPGTGILAVSLAGAPAGQLPAALAALEADADQLAARETEAARQRERARVLHAEGLLARSELDAAEGRWAALASDLEAARQRLRAALIEHERRHGSVDTEASIARVHLAAAQAQETSLRLQLEGARRLHDSLTERLALLDRKRGQFELTAPLAGTVFGDDLPRMAGQYFVKGAEICRIAPTGELLVRVQVAEQAIGDIAAGYAVRVKTRAFPDRVFHGTVSKIGGESELDANGQRTYRVELTIQNQQALLRPGMTVFARVDFGRRMVGWLLTHKLKQALRPEMWML